jgi:hypothetical protein
MAEKATDKKPEQNADNIDSKDKADADFMDRWRERREAEMKKSIAERKAEHEQLHKLRDQIKDLERERERPRIAVSDTAKE